MTPEKKKLVVEELLVKPSAVSPTLFVGLGGCGCRMVVRIARHLQRRPDYGERYRDLVKFALVDTNVNDLETYREHANETFLISDFEKEQYANLASGKLFLEPDPYFTQWVPQTYRFRAGDTAGAGQIRIESRLGVFYQMKHKDFVPRFRKLLEDLKSHEHGHRRLDSSEIQIVLCFSVAGGTGSGCNLPIAYMLREQAKELGKPTIIGVAVLPAVFEDKTRANTDGTFANGYAALKEIEHLMRLGAPESRSFPADGIEFHYDPSSPARRVVRDRPFEYLYVVDKPESFSVSEPVDAAADGLYLQLFSPLFREQAADYDNYTQHQRFLVPHDFEAKGIQGFTSFYGAYGSAVLLVPVAGLVDYCARAASLSLLRESFLGSIPGDPTYAMLRTNPDLFFEVTASDEKNERPVHESELHRKNATDRERLRDRLFMKRVRLLAHCESLEQREDGRFLALFRHGHRPGEVPAIGGGVEMKPDRVKRDQEQIAEGGMRFSIGGLVLAAIDGPQRGRHAPGLVEHAGQRIEAFRQENPSSASGEARVSELKGRAAVWAQEYRQQGLRVLNEGYTVGTVRYPGLNALVELQFLRDEAGEVDLAAKRYAVLSVLEQTRWPTGPIEPAPDFDLGGHRDGDLIREKDMPGVVAQLEDQAVAIAMAQVRKVFADKLALLRENLRRYARTQLRFEEMFDGVEREQAHQLAKLREEGDQVANQYVLDAEALQIEDGRRLWDFYYADRVAGLPELSLSDRRIQQLLSDEVTNLSLVGGGGATVKLDRLVAALQAHARGLLATIVGGDPHAAEREKREGLTLSDALELEVVYRALYRSNTEAIKTKGDAEVRRVVAEYRAQPEEAKVKLDAATHRDYLRDKIKRVVNEKASLLCVYDESRDRHGGVRPDHVFLAAIDENFRNGTIADVLKAADSELKWVTTGWHNPKEIVFYRSVLNVPLYVFGRMDDMKEHYHRFRRLAKRSKVLHIDKSWEETLPDLDPDSSQAEHRKKLVRDQIINFAALLTTGRPGEGRHRWVVRRDGRYLLVDPTSADPEDEDGDGYAVLGASLTEAIERLPDVLVAEKVKYLPFQQFLHGVREGIAPQVLARIVELPFRWQRNRDQLRTQYGSNPTIEQVEKIRDYGESARRLHESLEDLLARLRNREIEQQALGEDGSAAVGVVHDRARESLSQSIDILKAFSEVWRQVEDPGATPKEIPNDFRSLFEPLAAKDFTTALERLKKAFNPSAPDNRGGGGNGGNGGAPPQAPEGTGPETPAPPPPAGAATDASPRRGRRGAPPSQEAGDAAPGAGGAA